MTASNPVGDSPEPEPETLAGLLDERWADGALAGLAGTDDADAPLLPAGPVPRALWEAALLGPVRDVLARPSKGFRARLVALGWRLGGGDERRMPAALPALLELVHAGSLVVDDVEDDSSQRRGRACLHRLVGAPLAINTGNWLYFWPFELLGELDLPPAIEAELRRRLGRTMLRCHFGQALDLAADVGQLPMRWVPSVVRACAELKTGALTELATATGAVAAGAPAARVAAVARFGRRLGLGLQMLDDDGNLGGGREAHAGAPADKRHEDLRLGRPSWPWAWAAQQLDEVGFGTLQAEARVVHARHAAGLPADAAPLAARLRAAVGMRGRRAARLLLERALADLEHATGGAPAELAELRALIARLEAAYV